MGNLTLDLQAKMYVFDLNNCAKEYWFKDDDEWDLCLVSGEKKLEIERNYHPTISKKDLPEALIQLHRMVKSKLPRINPHLLKPQHPEDSIQTPEYLIAFNKNRRR